MAKQSKIRWRESDEKELSKAIKNYNAKLSRIQKKNPEMMEFMPSRVSKSDLKKGISTRKDFQNNLKYLKGFTVKGAERVIENSQGAKLTQFDIDRIKEQDRIDNIRRAKRRKELEDKEITFKNKPTGRKRFEMGTIKENDVKHRKRNIDKMKPNDVKSALLLIDKKINESYYKGREELLFTNYIKALLNEGTSMDIVKMMSKVPIEKFVELIDTDIVAGIDFIYTEDDRQARDESLREFWEEHTTDNEDTKLSLLTDIAIDDYNLEIGEY